MANIAFLFPGQGSQAVGMGQDYYDRFPESKAIFDQANEILGFDLKGMIFNGSKEELQKTENTQPALLTMSVAVLKVLGTKGITAKVCAGHSLGEFSAHVAAGTLSFEDGLKTVRKRGELMASSDQSGQGMMAAIIGLEDSVVEAICKTASESGLVIPANYNCPGQVVISGERRGVEEGIRLAKEAKARMAVPLEVSGAFHSPLIQEASIKFEGFLKDISINKPNIPVVSNVTADVVEWDKVKTCWVKQMLSSVLWKKSVDKMIDMGVDTFIEVGAGKVLQGLVKKTNRQVNTFGTDSINSLEKTLEKLTG
ncbi:MAG TPA: [acyl-carrier-protein] S-malonyltransferase [Spirochaetes bacterium]|nr:[acyl-carrier-protein] S-malonyltransferase [Spirochaetota bacterium]